MENALTKDDLKTLDELLSSTFNSILRIEERSLNNRLTEGLSIAELHTICAVGLHEANPMKVIANRLGITLATLTVMINKLEKRSYVKRERSETDRRQVLVALTAKGRKAMRAHDAFHKKMVESALADLTPEEEGVFVKAVGKIKAFFRNKWVGFTLASLLYTLWFVVWTGNLWMLLGLVVIFDLYISKFFYRYVWCHNVRLCQRSKTYKTVYEWINAIIFATVVASLVHIFIFQMYVIPTSSMEKSLLIGDYLYVSKVTYGPQMPNTPLSFPFVHHTMPFSQTKKSFSEAVKWPYHRLKGLRRIKRNDVVVFNFPAGDTVLLENQAVTYYDVLRGYEESFGKEEGRKRLAEKYTIVSRPVDKRENYIKRCVAIAGDSLEVRDGQVWVNGSPQEPFPGIQYQYVVQVTSPLTQYALDNLGITEYTGNGSMYYMFLTDEAAEKVRALGNVLSVRRYIYTPNTDVFPQWAEPRWSQDNYGPIWIPQKGATVQLTAENLPLYRRIIETYEGHELEERDGRIYIDGAEAGSYTFGMDYYWMMGDNRHNSADSRFWGFVPEDHIVGKASFVWLSLDANKSFPSNIRWERLFRKVR